MRIVAVTIWYDERPAHLHRLARSLEGFADGLCAVDGSYSYYPGGGSTRSHPRQVEMLTQACELAGVELLLHQPSALWEGEVAKRNAALRFAATLRPDWVLIVDGDTEVGNHDGARDVLESTRFDVAAVRQIDDEGVADRTWCDYRSVFRYDATLHYWRTHYIVRSGERLLQCPLPPDERRALDLPPLVSACSLRGNLTLIHHPKDPARRKAAEVSYVARDRIGVEALGS